MVPVSDQMPRDLLKHLISTTWIFLCSSAFTFPQFTCSIYKCKSKQSIYEMLKIIHRKVLWSICLWPTNSYKELRNKVFRLHLKFNKIPCFLVFVEWELQTIGWMSIWIYPVHHRSHLWVNIKLLEDSFKNSLSVCPVLEIVLTM